jgi:hypothetical protein
MHAKKAESLATCERAANAVDATMREALHIITHPAQQPLWGTLGTAAILPVMGLNLLLLDLNWVVTARTDDETWERAYPAPPEDGSDHDRIT